MRFRQVRRHTFSAVVLLLLMGALGAQVKRASAETLTVYKNPT